MAELFPRTCRTARWANGALVVMASAPGTAPPAGPGEELPTSLAWPPSRPTTLAHAGSFAAAAVTSSRPSDVTKWTPANLRPEQICEHRPEVFHRHDEIRSVTRCSPTHRRGRRPKSVTNSDPLEGLIEPLRSTSDAPSPTAPTGVVRPCLRGDPIGNVTHVGDLGDSHSTGRSPADAPRNRHSHPRSRASRAAAMRFVTPSFPIASDM